VTYKNDWPVVDGDVRPARMDGTCFYCSSPLGGQHREGCVIRTKTVVVAVTFTYIREVPEDWEPSMTEFHMNESSSCQDNLAEEVGDLTPPEGYECICGHVTGTVVREATEEDEKTLPRKVRD
jgi:hypothetical protein